MSLYTMHWKVLFPMSSLLILKWVGAIKGEKDDNKDAKWIADLFKLGLVRSSYIPSKDIRILREFTRYQYKLINTRSSKKNRFQNALTVGNCKIDMVFLMSLANLWYYVKILDYINVRNLIN